MKILIVATFAPYPVTSGAQKELDSYMSYLQSLGNEVHFLLINRFYIPKGFNEKLSNSRNITLAKLGERFHEYKCNIFENIKINSMILLRKIFSNEYQHIDDRYTYSMSKAYRALDNKYHFEAVIVNYFYLSKMLDAVKVNKKAIFTHDSFSMNHKTSLYKAAYYLTKEQEKKALERANYIFAVQSIEAAYFKKLFSTRMVLTTYVKTRFYEQPLIDNHNIVYISGASDFNKKGIVWFIENILPGISALYSDTKLCIGGPICGLMHKYKDSENIKLYGYVEDPYSFFMNGDIAINPTFLGSGLKIKTIESISYSKVTFVREHSAIGIFDSDNAPVFRSDNPQSWIENINSLWKSNKKILKIKQRTKVYINEMNRFIDSEYLSFLKS